MLCHALCDALLGAAGLGDIGTHFPDTDAKWKGAASLVFLEHTRKLLDGRGLRISHLDAVVICERPKLGPHFPAMRTAIAKALGIAGEQINLKAKTNEGTGELGGARRLRRIRLLRWKVSLSDWFGIIPSAAKAALNLARISARLKPCPDVKQKI